MGILYYNIGENVDAFTIGRGSELPYYVLQPHQIHGNRVAIISNRNTVSDELHGVDALITNLVDCPIGVRTADCVPIFLYDSRKKVVAVAHSGWRGTVLKITESVIIKMNEIYGTLPSDLHAIIGPSIGQESFNVKSDVVDAFQKAGFPIDKICKQKDDVTYLIDLWKANKWILINNGVMTDNIYTAGICTYIDHNKFYSARYEKNNKCGRNINVINLKGVY